MHSNPALSKMRRGRKRRAVVRVATLCVALSYSTKLVSGMAARSASIKASSTFIAETHKNLKAPRTSSTAHDLVHQAMQIRRSRSINEELLNRSLSMTRKSLRKESIINHLFQELDQNDNEMTGTEMLALVQQQEIAHLTRKHIDVPDSELHLQMEAARKRSSREIPAFSISEIAASAMIETVACEEDTSTSEKFAMKVIPQQLPGPVAKQFRPSFMEAKESISVVSGIAEKVKRNKRTILSQEAELRLIKLIHEGAKLNGIKTDFEAENKREITREEWSNLAGKSQKELRRLVAEYREAKTTLVMANMGLVHAVVKNLYRYSLSGSADIDKEMDLVQEGSLGLIRAAELFDPSKGVRFSTYATIWIKGVLSHAQNHHTISVPSREKAKWNKISRAIKQLEQENSDGNGINIESISRTCGIPVEQVTVTLSKMPLAKNILSLDMKYNRHSRSGSTQSSTNEVGLYGDKAFMVDSDLAETIQMKTDVVAALARNLDSREARLMRLRYGLHDGQTRSITECAAAMGISKQRASQLAKGCLKKLREAEEAASLQEYLLTVA